VDSFDASGRSFMQHRLYLGLNDGLVNRLNLTHDWFLDGGLDGLNDIAAHRLHHVVNGGLYFAVYFSRHYFSLVDGWQVLRR